MTEPQPVLSIESDADLGPLGRPLTVEERLVLEVIFEAASQPELASDEGVAWPCWDWVVWSTKLPIPDAERIWRDLPRVALPFGMNGTYGLTWQSTNGPLNGEMTVGLSIAGLHHVAPEIADGLIKILAKTAQTKIKVTPRSRIKPRNAEAPLADALVSTDSDITPSQGPAGLAIDLASTMLDREYFGLTTRPMVGRNSSVSGVLMVALGYSSAIHHYSSLGTSADFLRRIAAQQPRSVQSPMHLGPLALIQTIDYVGLVLRSHPDWPASSPRLVQAPDLESAASLGLEAVNQDQYRSRMIALANILDDMKVPDPAAAQRRNLGKPMASKSILRLEHWLQCTLGNNYDSDPITTLRSVKIIRDTLGHDTKQISADRITRATTWLRLDQYAQSPQANWQTIRVQTAGAFDTIRIAVAFDARQRSI